MARLLVLALCAGISDGLNYPSRNNATTLFTQRTVASVGFDLGDDEAPYNYMPKQKVLVCACAKCGSTSLFDFLFSQAFDRWWNYTGQPFIQDVMSPRWENQFTQITPAQAKRIIARPGTFSFALSRDPRSRIISGWKSKAACDGANWGTDVGDRAQFVPKLLALAGLPTADCLEFEAFVEALAEVHRKGLAKELNSHFRPQQYDCFRELEPTLWSRVAPISDVTAPRELAVQFGTASKRSQLKSRVTFPHTHSSPDSGPVNMTDRARTLLEEVTKEEYSILATARE